MYQAHWGLNGSPFSGETATFHSTPTHDEALARLFFLVEQRRRLGLLMGSAGSGKSTLLSFFARQMRREGRPVARLSLVGLQPGEMLALLGGEFSLALSPTAPLPLLWRALDDRLVEHRVQQVDTVVLLDDADQAAPAVLGQVSRMVVAGGAADARLTVVLAGQQDRIGRIGSRLLDLVDLRIDLAPWAETETAEYLNDVLSRAGRAAPVFDAAAVNQLHALARGIPRRVRRLADLSLLAGAGRQLDHVDADTVAAAFEELGVEA